MPTSSGRPTSFFGFLLYAYVIGQTDLIARLDVLLAVIAIGMLFSFLCSSIEMAIASLGQEELQQLQHEADALAGQKAAMKEPDYIRAQLRVLGALQIYYEAEKLNSPIVICNNIANVVVASFLPFALKAATTPPAAVNVFGWTMSPPGAGTEALTFFLTLVFIVIVGEIIPKRLGMNYSLWFVRKLSWLIRLINVLFGWLGASFVSVVEIPTWVFSLTRR